MRKLPHVAPLTPKRLRDPFDDPDWVFELKHDGFRGVTYVSEATCRIISRRDNVFKRFKSLQEALAKLHVRDAILDGEIISMNDEGVSMFNQLLFRRGVQYFYAFDLMWLNGRDLRSEPLIKRKERLRKLMLHADNPALLYADHVDQYGVDFFRMICEKNLEGIVAKHRASSYDNRAKWIKIKNPTYTQAQRRLELFEKSKRRG